MRLLVSFLEISDALHISSFLSGNADEQSLSDLLICSSSHPFAALLIMDPGKKAASWEHKRGKNNQLVQVKSVMSGSHLQQFYTCTPQKSACINSHAHCLGPSHIEPSKKFLHINFMGIDTKQKMWRRLGCPTHQAYTSRVTLTNQPMKAGILTSRNRSIYRETVGISNTPLMRFYKGTKIKFALHRILPLWCSVFWH